MPRLQLNHHLFQFQLINFVFKVKNVSVGYQFNEWAIQHSLLILRTIKISEKSYKNKRFLVCNERQYLLTMSYTFNITGSRFSIFAGNSSSLPLSFGTPKQLGNGKLQGRPFGNIALTDQNIYAYELSTNNDKNFRSNSF